MPDPAEEIVKLAQKCIEKVPMLIDRSDQNAPNQAMVLSRTVTAAKRAFLEAGNHKDVLANFTIDSPVPYDMQEVLKELKRLDAEMVPGARGEKQGEFHGRLSRFVARLENKLTDRRLGFMMAAPAKANKFDWLAKPAKSLMAGTRDQADKQGGVKIIDFSEVPSDILPLIVSRIASLIFSVQQWTPKSQRHPIALLCDEAHLYMPNKNDAGSVGDAALRYFERIAKEGRKYGVGMVVISQRPSEVSRTVLSQCNNFVALRLTNAEDQGVVQRMLPDSLGGFADLLPLLDTGEALVVGDASLLPSRIRITEPRAHPDRDTIDFWDEWERRRAAGGNRFLGRCVAKAKSDNQVTANCSMMRVGFQTVVWGRRIDDLDHLLAALTACGYEGVEFGQNHRDIYVRENGSARPIGSIQRLKERCRAHELELIGLVGGTLEERMKFCGEDRSAYLYADSWSDDCVKALESDNPFTLALHPHWFMPVRKLKRVDEILAGFSPFSEVDLKNATSFATKLKEATDKISTYLRGLLSDSTRQSLANWQTATEVDLAVRSSLIADLNRIIKGPSLWAADHFVAVEIREETRKLIQHSLEGLNLHFSPVSGTRAVKVIF